MIKIYIDEKYYQDEGRTVLCLLFLDELEIKNIDSKIRNIIKSNCKNEKQLVNLLHDYKAKKLSKFKYLPKIIEVIKENAIQVLYVEVKANKEDAYFVREYNKLLFRLREEFANMHIVIDKVDNPHFSRAIVSGVINCIFVESYNFKGVQFADLLLANFLEPFKLSVI